MDLTSFRTTAKDTAISETFAIGVETMQFIMSLNLRDKSSSPRCSRLSKQANANIQFDSIAPFRDSHLNIEHELWFVINRCHLLLNYITYIKLHETVGATSFSVRV